MPDRISPCRVRASSCSASGASGSSTVYRTAPILTGRSPTTRASSIAAPGVGAMPITIPPYHLIQRREQGLGPLASRLRCLVIEALQAGAAGRS